MAGTLSLIPFLLALNLIPVRAQTIPCDTHRPDAIASTACAADATAMIGHLDQQVQDLRKVMRTLVSTDEQARLKQWQHVLDEIPANTGLVDQINQRKNAWEQIQEIWKPILARNKTLIERLNQSQHYQIQPADSDRMGYIVGSKQTFQGETFTMQISVQSLPQLNPAVIDMPNERPDIFDASGSLRAEAINQELAHLRTQELFEYDSRFAHRDPLVVNDTHRATAEATIALFDNPDSLNSHPLASENCKDQLGWLYDQQILSRNYQAPPKFEKDIVRTYATDVPKDAIRTGVPAENPNGPWKKGPCAGNKNGADGDWGELRSAGINSALSIPQYDGAVGRDLNGQEATQLAQWDFLRSHPGCRQIVEFRYDPNLQTVVYDVLPLTKERKQELVSERDDYKEEIREATAASNPPSPPFNYLQQILLPLMQTHPDDGSNSTNSTTTDSDH
jgi:hypothetical protein